MKMKMLIFHCQNQIWVRPCSGNMFCSKPNAVFPIYGETVVDIEKLAKFWSRDQKFSNKNCPWRCRLMALPPQKIFACGAQNTDWCPLSRTQYLYGPQIPKGDIFFSAITLLLIKKSCPRCTILSATLIKNETFSNNNKNINLSSMKITEDKIKPMTYLCIS